MLAWPFSVPCLFIYTYRMILSLCNMFRLVSSLIQFKVKPAVFAITAIHVLLSRKYIELFLSLIGTKLGFIFSKLSWSLHYKYLRLWITLTFIITIMKKLIKVCRHATKRIYLVLMLKWNSPPMTDIDDQGLPQSAVVYQGMTISLVTIETV